jgi:hypothetical protein
VERNESQVRVGLNEAFFRDVNEALGSGSWPGEADATTTFRCECARLGCNRMVTATAREYEQVRAHSRRFIIATGHELPESETVLVVREGYAVVEKRDEAGRLADATDPRR